MPCHGAAKREPVRNCFWESGSGVHHLFSVIPRLKEQVCLNLYRIRNRPSLALHCGGNEFNPCSFGNASSMFVIERNIRDLDPSRPFKRTTPDMGSAHIYRDMEPARYRRCYGQLPFVAESGIHSFPSAKSLRQLMSAVESARPVDNMMDDSFRRTHPELLNHFTEYVPERVPRMLARASAITDIASAGIEELAEATQMASAEFYQIMSQSMRENYPVTGGLTMSPSAWMFTAAAFTPAGRGARHIAFSPDGAVPYHICRAG